MAEEAMTFVRENFSRELMCARTLNVYAEVLGLAPTEASAE